MMTIVTHVHLRQGAGPDWDAAMRTRLSAARKASGWIGGQLLRPAEKPDRRVIVGTWRTRADWEAWHHDPQFTETRQRLEGLERYAQDYAMDFRRWFAPRGSRHNGMFFLLACRVSRVRMCPIPHIWVMKSGRQLSAGVRPSSYMGHEMRGVPLRRGY
jgi:heme-degrading monooxygenase HmoA